MTLWADIERRIRDAMQKADAQETEALELLDGGPTMKDDTTTTTTYDALIDALDKALELCKTLKSGRERALVMTKIEEAQLWAGMLPERRNEGLAKDEAATP